MAMIYPVTSAKKIVAMPLHHAAVEITRVSKWKRIILAYNLCMPRMCQISGFTQAASSAAACNVIRLNAVNRTGAA
ncbi:MAG: hypothetical protein U5N55_07970 [Cypionkella sp.]|nr:hypothetical protein [Cypionkella sp.]